MTTPDLQPKKQPKGLLFGCFAILVSERHALGEVGFHLLDGDAHLLHGVALADGDAVVGGGVLVAHGVEVEGDAVRRADLVGAAVALADGAGLVVVDHEVLRQLGVQLLRRSREHLLLAQRQDRRLVRRERRVQVQHGAHVVVALLVLAHDLLVVGVAEERQRHAVAAEARLDDVGDVVLVGLRVEVGEILAARLLMAPEVVVRAVGDAPQLAPVGEREGVLDVGGGAGVEGKARE